MLTEKRKKVLEELKREYIELKKGKSSLLKIINEVETPEAVYNSNAIENSTLTISETEDILFNMEVSRTITLREIFEAKNLAKVSDYIFKNYKKISLENENILLLHKMLMLNINDEIAGRFRNNREFVRVGKYIAPIPTEILRLMKKLIFDYENEDFYTLSRIAKFHLEFEKTHPFVDGNGRVGRLLINLLLLKNNFPPLIVRDKEKEKYYKFFKLYDKNDRISKEKAVKEFSKFLYLQTVESFYKRRAYLKGLKITTLREYAKEHSHSHSNLINKAKRQTIKAFREKGVWKIGSEVES